MWAAQEVVIKKLGIDVDETDWAYLAGLIDGDGSIFCSKRKKGGLYRIFVSLSNNNVDLLRDIAHKFGGAAGNWQSTNYVAHRLAWEAREAKRIVIGILPYIDGKWEQAALALKFPTPGKGQFTRPSLKQQAYRAEQEKVYNAMRELNQKWSRGKVEGARQCL